MQPTTTILSTYRDAFTSKLQNDNRIIRILKDDIPEEIRDHLLDLIQHVNETAGSLDLSYSIVSDAVALLPTNPDDLTSFDPYQLTEDIASVYTHDRLAYLTPLNQSDITEVLRESNADDIATACAIWYDRQVIDTLSDLVDFFTHNS